MNFSSETTEIKIKLEPETANRAVQYAITNYNFSDYNNLGNTPKVLELNNKRYLLVTTAHDAVCDDPECQEAYNNNCGLELMHCFVPIYTYNTNHELCIYHIFEKHKAVIPSNQVLTAEENDVIYSIYDSLY